MRLLKRCLGNLWVPSGPYLTLSPRQISDLSPFVRDNKRQPQPEAQLRVPLASLQLLAVSAVVLSLSTAAVVKVALTAALGQTGDAGV